MPSEVPTVSGDQSVEELRRQLAEAREQQTATAEILSVISSSPLDLGLVFAQVAASAVRLCDAYDAVIFQVDGEMLRLVAHHGQIPVIGRTGQARMTLTRGTPVGRAVLEKQTIHIADLQAKTEEYPEGSDFALSLGYRTSLAVPLVVSGTAVGAISIRRAEARQFTDRQIQLLKVFANQAVIAIKNTRLFEAEQASKRELQTSLEYQTAVSEVLKVISRSPADLQTVLDTIARIANGLCAADATVLFKEGTDLRGMSHCGAVPLGDATVPIGRDWVSGRTVLDRRAVHVHDLAAADHEFPVGSDIAKQLGHRTTLGVPLLQEEEAIGCLLLRRDIVKPFTDKQIDLLGTFADQAVIAIENTRLFEEVQTRTSELTESLEYQTAISEVLSVISRSPTDVQPVFDMIAQSAARLCRAQFCHVFRFDGTLIHFAAVHGLTPEGREALQSLYPMPPGRATAVARSILTCAVEEIPDVRADTEYSVAHSLVIGFRSVAAVPMLKDGRPIGAIAVLRSHTGHFPASQIELLKTFADQAVIAIENARLFEAEQASKRELQESLEYQTATSDVLGVISRSPNESQPVFNGIVATAQRLCEAYDASIVLRDGERLKLKAHVGPIPMREEWPLGNRGLVVPRSVMDRKAVHVHDLAAAEGDFPEGREDALKLGHRSILAVPLVHKGEGIGTLVVRRFEVRPFSDRQIALLTTFADQAVIAIENTRLFEAEQTRTKELAESLEHQTATSEVLGVIARSPSDVQRVLDAVAEKAARVCGAEDARLIRAVGGEFRQVAQFGTLPHAHANIASWKITRGTVTGRAFLERRTVHVEDLAAVLESEYPDAKKFQAAIGHRTTLATPLIRDGDPLGILLIRRRNVAPFADKQIKLLETFADQAVIAIENARLFEAEQVRTREVEEALETQTATAAILRVIASSPSDLAPVLSAVAESASRLCGAFDALVLLRKGDELQTLAHYGPIPAHAGGPIARDWVIGRAFVDQTPVQVEDLTAAGADFPRGYAMAIRDGFRTSLAIPMQRKGEPVGVICVRRTEPRPFIEKQIALLLTFADQAVIAIENARLFEAEQARTKEVEAKSAELRESLEYQTATSEVLSVISRSPNNVQPVLDTIARIAQRLCQAEHAFVLQREEGGYRLVASNDALPDWVSAIKASPLPPDRSSLTGRVAIERRTVHIDDLRADPEYTLGPTLQRGVRSELGVPLMRDGEVIGVIIVGRTEVRPFSNRQIALIETFADQAVIAIENTRLFEAEQASKRELARSVEELESLGKVSQAVNSSLELDKVLPTILEHACAMSYAGGGTVYVFDKTTTEFRLAAAHNMSDEHIAMVRAQPMRLNSVVVGECATRREVAQVADLNSAAPSPLIDILLRTGVRAVLAVPLLHQAEVVGVLVVRRNQPGTFSPEVIRLVEAFAAQSAIAVENARLFGEIAKKSRELEIASQHKSQFVANMSHELRTPLAAILGYAELMQEGFYEPLGQKSLDALNRIRSNGKHLLGLINTVLDIAKIESGQFNLNMAEYAIDSMVETVRAATESLAQNKKLTLTTEVVKSLPIGLGDEQRLTQVLLNLVGNAIKFTDTGEVRVTAKAVNGHFNVTVADTGPGIPPAEQTRIFEQFHQIDSSLTKAKGGTGLGLAIAKQIVEMHGGRIWVESTVGKGSTFQMEIPTRATTT